MHEQYDIFVSHASENYAKALEYRGQLGDLAVFLDELENRPPSTVLGVVRANLRLLFRRLIQREEPERPTKTDDEIRGLLRSKMDCSKSILVVWSYSHRGSYWANEEISYFEEKYPDRRVFYLRVDPTEAPDSWIFLEGPRDLTREQIDATADALEPKSKQGEWLEDTKPDAPELFLNPRRWTRRAAERQAGTSFSELVRLRVRYNQDPRCIELTRSARSAVLLAVMATGMLLMLTSLFLLSGGRDQCFARNAVLAVTSVWICLAFTGIQMSAAAVVPATIAGALIGVGVELFIALTSKDTRGGGPAGAAIGAFMGVAAAYQWHLSASRVGQRASGPTQWQWVLKTALLAICAVVALASLIAALLVPTNGNLRGGLAVAIVLLLASIPFGAIWVEVAYWGRLKEFFRYGSKPAAVLLGAFLAVGIVSGLGIPPSSNPRCPVASSAGLSAACVYPSCTCYPAPFSEPACHRTCEHWVLSLRLWSRSFA